MRCSLDVACGFFHIFPSFFTSFLSLPFCAHVQVHETKRVAAFGMQKVLRAPGGPSRAAAHRSTTVAACPLSKTRCLLMFLFHSYATQAPRDLTVAKKGCCETEIGRQWPLRLCFPSNASIRTAFRVPTTWHASTVSACEVQTRDWRGVDGMNGVRPPFFSTLDACRRAECAGCTQLKCSRCADGGTRARKQGYRRRRRCRRACCCGASCLHDRSRRRWKRAGVGAASSWRGRGRESEGERERERERKAGFRPPRVLPARARQ